MSKQDKKWQTSELVGGPQDGAKVTIGSLSVLPQTLYVGLKHLGDAYSAWGREPSKHFPACYVLDIDKHKFKGCCK